MQCFLHYTKIHFPIHEVHLTSLPLRRWKPLPAIDILKFFQVITAPSHRKNYSSIHSFSHLCKPVKLLQWDIFFSFPLPYCLFLVLRQSLSLPVFFLLVLNEEQKATLCLMNIDAVMAAHNPFVFCIQQPIYFLL